MVLCVAAPSMTQEEMFDKEPAFNLIFVKNSPLVPMIHDAITELSIVLWWIPKQGIWGVHSTSSALHR